MVNFILTKFRAHTGGYLYFNKTFEEQSGTQIEIRRTDIKQDSTNTLSTPPSENESIQFWIKLSWSSFFQYDEMNLN